MQEQNPAERQTGSGRWWIVGVAGAFVVAALVAGLLIFTGKDEPAGANGTATTSTTAVKQDQPAKPDTGRTPAQLSLPGAVPRSSSRRTSTPRAPSRSPKGSTKPPGGVPSWGPTTASRCCPGT